MTDKSPVTTDLDDLRTKRELLRREEIYRSILLAAEKVLLAKGYTAMTMDDVAREACLSKATLYKYIDSKSKVLFEIICRYLDDQMEMVRQIVATKKRNSEKLRAIIAEIVSFHQAKSNIGRIMMVDESAFKFLRLIYENDGKDENTLFQKRLSLLKEKHLLVVKLITGVIEKGVATGEFRPVHPMETVFFLEALLSGINQARFWDKKKIDLLEGELSEKIFVFVYSSLSVQRETPFNDTVQKAYGCSRRGAKGVRECKTRTAAKTTSKRWASLPMRRVTVF